PERAGPAYGPRRGSRAVPRAAGGLRLGHGRRGARRGRQAGGGWRPRLLRPSRTPGRPADRLTIRGALVTLATRPSPDVRVARRRSTAERTGCQGVGRLGGPPRDRELALHTVQRHRRRRHRSRRLPRAGAVLRGRSRSPDALLTSGIAEWWSL